jgi:hypothetical protein
MMPYHSSLISTRRFSIILGAKVSGRQLKNLESVHFAMRRKGSREKGSASVFHSKEVIEVRKKGVILNGLDENGALEGLPFMPEMHEYCGRRLRVLRPLNRIFVEGIGNRVIRNTVILDGVTCNGKAHGGCQRTCFLLWKQAWLEKVSERNIGEPTVSASFHSERMGARDSRDQMFSCQLTQLPAATRGLAVSVEDFVRQYSCNQRPRTSGSVERVGALILWLNFRIQKSLGRKKYAMLHGILKRTPTISMGLQHGESVDVKSKEEILATLDLRGKNRGLSFTVEMLKFCGRRFQVLKRVEKMINEKTSKIGQIRNTVILEGVTCDGSDHNGCPRNCYLLWREIWLKKV